MGFCTRRGCRRLRRLLLYRCALLYFRRNDDFYDDDDEKMTRARTKRRGEDEGSTRVVMVTFCCEEKQGDAPLSGCGKCHVQNEVVRFELNATKTTHTSKLLRLRITFTFFFSVCISIALFVRGDAVDFLAMRLQLELSRVRRVAHVANVSRVQVRL